MTDEATLAWYEREAPHYTASGTQGQSRHLDGFLDRLDDGAHILELGCGGGRDAAYIRDRGFSIDATDGTAAMVRKANGLYDRRSTIADRSKMKEGPDAEAKVDEPDKVALRLREPLLRRRADDALPESRRRAPHPEPSLPLLRLE